MRSPTPLRYFLETLAQGFLLLVLSFVSNYAFNQTLALPKDSCSPLGGQVYLETAGLMTEVENA